MKIIIIFCLSAIAVCVWCSQLWSAAQDSQALLIAQLATAPGYGQWANTGQSPVLLVFTDFHTTAKRTLCCYRLYEMLKAMNHNPENRENRKKKIEKRSIRCAPMMPLKSLRNVYLLIAQTIQECCACLSLLLKSNVVSSVSYLLWASTNFHRIQLFWFDFAKSNDASGAFPSFEIVLSWID